MKYYLFLTFLVGVLLFSCTNKDTKKTSSTKSSSTQNHGPTVTNVTSCSVPISQLKGRQALDERFLNHIEQVQLDSLWLKNNEGMVFIPGGIFEMGGDFPPGTEHLPTTALAQPDELPKHKVQVSDFYMDEHEVTVREFKEFVDATGYKTVAEYDMDWEEIKKQFPPNTPKPNDELLQAGSMVFHYPPKETQKNDLANWWKYTPGITWRNPDGKTTSVNEILDFPVTQVSWYDAMAYAKWKGKRLPTEAEYEYAMRGGNDNTLYPWGNELLTKGEHRGNFLQGEFPYYNTGADGFEFLAPIKSFAPNPYGLYDISGNVWEWTNDWYGANYYYTLSTQSKMAIDPQGPEKTFEVYDKNAINKVVRGGSFLCNDDWCSGYRNARRMRLTPDSGMQHLGFRCVRDANT